MDTPTDIAVQSENNTAVVANPSNGTLIEIDLETGNRSNISGPGFAFDGSGSHWLVTIGYVQGCSICLELYLGCYFRS